MAKKVSELTSAGTLATDDLLLLTDSSEVESKKVSVEQLMGSGVATVVLQVDPAVTPTTNGAIWITTT